MSLRHHCLAALCVASIGTASLAQAQTLPTLQEMEVEARMASSQR